MDSLYKLPRKQTHKEAVAVTHTVEPSTKNRGWDTGRIRYVFVELREGTETGPGLDICQGDNSQEQGLGMW